MMTCGSVDDGKSTLLGRILFETNNIFQDQSEYLDSIKLNHDDEIDYSLLLDGLIDEKSQGITIDLAFKYLNYKDKNIVFIDSPGHEEFTKNTAYAATLADVAVILVDSTKGVLSQTKNHMSIVSLFQQIILENNPETVILYTGYNDLNAAYHGHRFEYYDDVNNLLKSGFEIEKNKPSLKNILLKTLGFTYLNPHVYSDTVFFLGNFSKNFFITHKYLFGIGASISSFIFFFALGYLSKLLSRYLNNSETWKAINSFIIIFMGSLALYVLIEIVINLTSMY